MTNDASTFKGEACPSGAVEPAPMTEHIMLASARPDETRYETLPQTEQKPEE